MDSVQFPADHAKSAIAARSDVRNDAGRDRLDVGRRLALGGKKGAETLGEIRGAAVETDRHGPVLPAGRISGQWRGWEEPSTPGVGRVVGMDWTRGRRPGRPQIGKL